MREEAAKKERDKHINNIWPMILTKQDWRVKEKANTPVNTTLNDDMALLDDDKALLINDGSSPPTSMNINMLFMLPIEFEKPKESSQHLKPLYIWGHIDGKPISRMLIDGGAAVNLMSYVMFKKLR
jgi:hypothetical protein